MIEPLTPNTQAILLLTAPLILGRGELSRELLTLEEFNLLARALREQQKQASDLLGPDAKSILERCSPPLDAARLTSLLGRGFLLSQAVERWSSRMIWVISRVDPSYPRQLKERLLEEAPPILYGCGEVTLLEKGGLVADQATMHGALATGGIVAAVMSDGLERAALVRDNRKPLMEGKLVLISPNDPASGFNAGHSTQSRKLIRGLADMPVE